MARHKDPKKTAEKWANNLGRSTTQIREGVESVSEAPGVKAAKAKDRMRARLLASIDDGTWEKRVAAVSLDEWKEKMLTKGVNRIGEGAEAAVDKQVDFYTQLDAHQSKIDTKLDKMPNVTLDDGIERAVTQIKGMAKFRRS